MEFFPDYTRQYSKALHIQFCVNSRTVVAANKLLTSNSTRYNTKIKYAYIKHCPGCSLYCCIVFIHIYTMYV